MRVHSLALFVTSLLLTACSGSEADDGSPRCGPASAAAHAPSTMSRPTGPGGPSTAFQASEINTVCGYLDAGPNDVDHHDLVSMIDGYLLLPWAHEAGGGLPAGYNGSATPTAGLAVFDFHDPCHASLVANVEHKKLRETHTMGYALGQERFLAINDFNGVQLWDVTDATQPSLASRLELPGVFYPDAYARVVMMEFYQAPYLYAAAGDNGMFIIDATDPRNPVLVAEWHPDVPMRVGLVHAVGNLLVVQAMEGSAVVLLDISDPKTPTFVNSYFMLDSSEHARAQYFGNVNGGYTWHARKENGGGLIIMDIHDPMNPTFVGDTYENTDGAGGGYVILKEGIAFTGQSGYEEALDVTDPSQPTQVMRFDMQDVGDQDFIVPVGNVAVLNTDEPKEPACRGKASQVMPFSTEPDTRAPKVNWVIPEDGERDLAVTSRVGITLDEWIEPASVDLASFRVIDSCGHQLDGQYSVQDGTVNFWPKARLVRGGKYEVVIPAGGIVDYSGNAVAEDFRSTFETAR